MSLMADAWQFEVVSSSRFVAWELFDGVLRFRCCCNGGEGAGTAQQQKTT